jgi:hypothetical protein
MAKQLGHRSPLVFTLSLALLPWLGCSPSGSTPTDVDGGAAGTAGSAGAHAGGTTGSAGTHAGGTTGAAGTHAGTGGSIGNSTGGSASTQPGTGGNGPTPPTGSAGTTGTAGTTGSGTGTAGTTGSGTGTAGATGSSTGTAGTTGSGTGTAGTTGSGTGTAGATGSGTGTAGATGGGGTTVGGKINNVFVIAMENEPAAAIYGNKNAPYLNGLLSKSARATAFTDPLPDGIPSEPHYVWMEAGTNKFSDVTFTGDGDPSSGNSTSNTAHLSTQMNAAGVSWMGVMEGLNSSTGACPVSSSGLYAAKHDPFVFFQDIAGSPPSKSSAVCGAHHKAFTSGAALVAGTVPQYTFVAPNVCNDMHGDSSCPAGDVIAMGDAWLAATLPPLIDYVNAHNGVVFVVWDEPEGGSNLIPFFAIGPNIKAGYTSTVAFTHSSLVKTVEEIFGLPILPTVAGANDFADLFQPGMFP